VSINLLTLIGPDRGPEPVTRAGDASPPQPGGPTRDTQVIARTTITPAFSFPGLSFLQEGLNRDSLYIALLSIILHERVSSQPQVG
jgi:hypothetical protein